MGKHDSICFDKKAKATSVLACWEHETISIQMLTVTRIAQQGDRPEAKSVIEPANKAIRADDISECKRNPAPFLINENIRTFACCFCLAIILVKAANMPNVEQVQQPFKDIFHIVSIDFLLLAHKLHYSGSSPVNIKMFRSYNCCC